MNFLDKLKASSKKNDSFLCVGLDTDPTRLPECLKSEPDPILKFNQEIIAATKDLVSSYKPNIAFYETMGSKGINSLEKSLSEIPNEIPIILDAKRGDIANTSKQYAIAAFDEMKVDAVTLSPYMGIDTVEPFFSYGDKALFILLKTSNSSSVDLQDLELANGKKLYMHLAELIKTWQEKSAASLGVVVGATHPAELKAIREVLTDAPILLPGVGTQAGDIESTVNFGLGTSGQSPIIINSSRKILYASSGNDFAEKARAMAIQIKNEINSAKQ